MLKKFLILFCLIITILIINENKNYSKKYINNKENIYIEYPNLNNKTINNSINSYINSNITNQDYLFIDYDLIDNTNLTMYIYKESNNISKSITKKFTLNNKKQNNTYDFFNWKSIDKNKLIALTFDDGPNHNTNKVLDILEKYNVKATFFLLGTNIKGNEKIVKRMHSLDMEIGNHMYSHKITTRLKPEQIKEEISKTDKLIYDITRTYPTSIRPSYGIYNNKLKKNIDRPIILWNIDTLDWKYHDSKKIAERVFKNLNHSNIVLMHDIYNATANSLEIIIPTLLENDFKFITISELLYYNS